MIIACQIPGADPGFRGAEKNIIEGHDPQDFKIMNCYSLLKTIESN